jgi:hypothetical protein
METKTCTKCQETKTLDQFYKSYMKYSSDGIDYYCKYCRTGASIKSHIGGNKKPCSIEGCEKSHYAKSYCRMHYSRWDRTGSTETTNKSLKDGIYYYKGKPHYTKAYVLKYKYKLTIEEYDERAANGCNICGDKPERSLHVDHDHACCSGRGATCGNCVRGVVCNRCNTALGKYDNGLLREDNKLKDKIAEYVRKYNG